MLMSDATLTLFFFFFNDTATTEIYTLSLHDALPISISRQVTADERSAPMLINRARNCPEPELQLALLAPALERSEEHTSELQSLAYLVCRLLLEKKKNKFY